MKPPYLMSREEWRSECEKYRSQGSGLSRFTKGCASEQINKITQLQFLYFGVNEWLYNKALAGDKRALSKLDYGYDAYDYIILKAKEQQLIELPVKWVIKEFEASADRKILNTYNVCWYDWGYFDDVTLIVDTGETIYIYKDCVQIECNY